MWGASVCRNPLGSPVNLRTTDTGGQCLLSVHCVTLASAVSLSVPPSLWVEMSSSSYECASDSNISSILSWSVRILLAAILLNALQPNSTHTKPNIFWMIVIQASVLAWPVKCSCSNMEWTKSVELKIDISMNLHFKVEGRNPYSRKKDICL